MSVADLNLERAKAFPDAAGLDLLTACLADGERARAAWKRWRGASAFDKIGLATQRMLPLLHHNLRLAGVAADEVDMGRYHGHRRKAWVERRRLWAGLEPVLAEFAAAGIEMVALKGLALAARYYPNPALRPTGDADVWVPRERATEAIDRLLAAGWRPAHGRGRERLIGEDRVLRHGWEFYDARGACIDLHWRVSSLPGPPEWEAMLREQAEPWEVGGVTLKTLGATHHFYHVCLHGVTAGRAPTVHWVADAVTIWRTGKVDEAKLIETARRHRTGHLLATATGWLRATMGEGPVETAVDRLATLPTLVGADLEWAALVAAEPGARRRYQRWGRFLRMRKLDTEWRRGNVVAAYLRYLAWLASARRGRRQ